MTAYILNCRSNELTSKSGNGDVSTGIAYIPKDDCLSDGIISKPAKFLEARVVPIASRLTLVPMLVPTITAEQHTVRAAISSAWNDNSLILSAGKSERNSKVAGPAQIQCSIDWTLNSRQVWLIRHWSFILFLSYNTTCSMVAEFSHLAHRVFTSPREACWGGWWGSSMTREERDTADTAEC